MAERPAPDIPEAMPDLLSPFLSSAPVQGILGRVGVPRGAELRRHRAGDPVLDGPAVLLGFPGGRLESSAAAALAAFGVERLSAEDTEARLAALVYDASGIVRAEDLRDLYLAIHGHVRRFGPSARLVVLGTPPAELVDARAATAQEAVSGVVRTVAKELRRGGTAQLLQVSEGAESRLLPTLRFLLSGRSAYVDGQVVRVGAAGLTGEATGEDDVPTDWDRSLEGKVAVVTGPARGIGEAIARTLARDGASVVGVDIPAQGEALTRVCAEIGGTALALDLTGADAPRTLADHLADRHGGVDLVVHNAGITRDRTIAAMSEREWDGVLAINLLAQEKVTAELLDRGVLNPGGRIVCISSTTGLAGNRGQANYAATKAGVIGHVRALAPELAKAGGAINAIAPGMIATEMTAAMPAATREVASRLNSLSQAGLPIDIAEAVAWLGGPLGAGINGEVVRVCGQSLVGA